MAFEKLIWATLVKRQVINHGKCLKASYFHQICMMES